MRRQTYCRCPERLPVCFGMPRCLAKRVQRVTSVRRPEDLPACFGMRAVDGHGVRPQEFSLLFGAGV